jgi:hypothetical protein
VRLGSGQDEPHAGGRLLQELQQRVEGLTGESLGLVDDVDLLAALGRGGGGALPQLAGVVHTSVAGGVDLPDVEVAAVLDPLALVADAARLGGGTLLAVDHLGEDPCGGGLARASRT